MKGDTEVLKRLNEILTGELTAINQYFLHSRMLADWGYKKLADKVYHESIDEMKHAQTLVDRILFLKGVPNLQKLGTLNIGENVKEQLEADLEFEKNAIPKLKDAIEICSRVNDHGTREILEHILVDEESHYDWIETQIGIIDSIGIENYLAQQINS